MTAKEIVRLWVDAFNKADADALSRLYHANAVNHQVVNDPVKGREAIKNMFEEEFSQADMVCIVENLFEDGDWAILEWKDPLGLRGCGFFHVQDEKIIFQRGYWDKLSFLKLHNLPFPEIVSSGGKASSDS
jgi:limonene-1,2-epoxide hydrolase